MTVSMEQHVALSLLLVSALATVFAQEVIPCMTTRENCTGGGTGFSGLSVINNNYYCCTAGYSMRWYSSLCSCIKTHEVIPCDKGKTCRFGAGSFSLSGHKVQCCHSGYSMQSSSGFFNGHWFSRCTCTRYLGNSGGFVFVNSGVVNGSSSWDPNFNATEFEQRMKEWSQYMREWSQSMMVWSQVFSQSLSSSLMGMTSNIQRSISNTMFNLHRTLGSVFGRNRWF